MEINKTARWTLSPDIYRRIEANFKGNNVKFSNTDFIDLATKYGHDISAISRILNNLEKFKKIAVVDEIQKSRGGWKKKVYQVIVGANFSTRGGYREGVVNKEKHNTECALRLQAALGLTAIFKGYSEVKARSRF